MNAKAIGNDNDALSADFRDFITALSGRQVEFVLVGGYAVGAYGYYARGVAESTARLPAGSQRE